MSLLKANAVQLGQSITATNNFVLYQPASPDGTVRLGNGNSGSVTDLITVGTTGNLTFANSVSISAASTKTLTLNGGAGSNGLVLDASNNIGIGTGTPSVKLVVSNAGANGYEFDPVNGYISSYNRSTSAWTKLTTRASSYTFNLNNSVDALILDSSGNLGLGVTPNSGWSAGQIALQLPALTALSSGYDYAANLSNNGYRGASGNWYYIQTGQQATLYKQTGGQHQWLNSNNTNGTAGASWTPTQAMTLDASGALWVGATSSLGTTAKFISNTSNTSIDGPAIYAVNFNTGSTGVTAIVTSLGASGSSANTNCYHLRSITQGSNVYYLYGNGTSSFTSDQRLKKNIESTRDGYLEDLCKLRVVKYQWLANDDDSPKELGLIAQEVEEVFPGLVQDADLEINGHDVKVVKHSVIPFMLLKAIQELSAELNELKQRIK
jgi:hypothetical protein